MKKFEIELSTVIDEISMGPFGSDIKVNNFIDFGVPVLNGSNLTQVKLVEDSFNYISEIKANELGKANAKRGDIIVTHRGTLGQVSYIPENSRFNRYVISQSQFRVRFKSDCVDSKFISYLFYTDYGQKKLLSFKNHVGVPALAQATTNFKKLKLFIPKLSIQQRIASVLSSLDDKIELNNKINAELEAMAKTLYDYWFVQFDFPDANGKNYKTSGGKMVYNMELKREIPEGWEVKPINHFIKNDKNGDWGKEANENNYNLKVECIRGTDINGLNGNGDTKCPVRFILDKNKSKLLAPYDIVIEISGGSPTQSTGRLGYITDELLQRFDNPLICSNFCKAISLHNTTSFFYFIYTWNRLYSNNILFGFEGKTSGIKNLLFETFTSNYKVVVPDEKLQQKFFDFMSNIEKQKQTNLKQNQTLASLRDWLLPMLMNGQVTVNKAYEMVAEKLSMVAEE